MITTLFRAKEKFSVGLDIGSHTIKAVKIAFSNKAAELHAFCRESAQFNLEGALKSVKASLNSQGVRIGSSGTSTIIRYVTFPKMKKEELVHALRFEAQKHIPFPLADVNVDSFILKDDLPDNKMLVLLAALKKDWLRMRLKLLEDAGLKASIVDIDSIALLNAFLFNYSGDDSLKNKAIALINIGSSVSSIDVMENETLRLSRDIQVAGNSFTQKIADTLGIDFKSAEDLKVSGMNIKDEQKGQIAPALDSVLNNLTNELRTSFDYYESQSASSVSKIFLSGGGSLLANLKDTVSGALGIEVEYWDPLKRINLSKDIAQQDIKAASAQLAVAVGLALRK